MNNSADMEKFLNNALRMSRELLHAGAKGLKNDEQCEPATFCLDAGTAMLRLVHIVTRPNGEITALRESVEEYAEALARANVQLSDMARDANDASAREESLRKALVSAENDVVSYRGEYLSASRSLEAAETRAREAEARAAELEEILDDNERSNDSLRAERDDLRRGYGKVLAERDDALARLERTRRDIDKLIARYS